MSAKEKISFFSFFPIAPHSNGELLSPCARTKGRVGAMSAKETVSYFSLALIAPTLPLVRAHGDFFFFLESLLQISFDSNKYKKYLRTAGRMGEDSKCGLCGIYPKWLEGRATAKVFIIVYGLLGTVQSMAFVYVMVTLTTLEKRFKIPSQTTGKTFKN